MIMKKYMNPETAMVITETLMQSFGTSGSNPLEFKVVPEASQDNAL